MTKIIHNISRIFVRLLAVLLSKRIWNKKFMLAIFVVLSIISISYTLFSITGVKKYFVKTPEQNLEKEKQELIKVISKQMLLPSSSPTLATVTDVSKLKNEYFFRNSENNDKVLIYESEQQAILYRPSKKLIINVAPLRLDGPIASSSATSQNPSITAFPNLKILVLNASNTSGLASTYEDKIRSHADFSGVTISKNNATQKLENNYLLSRRSDIPQVQKKLEELLATSSATIAPEGEKVPDGYDFVLFVSK